MVTNEKCIYKTSVRINENTKNIIDKTFREISRKTGLKLSYGRIARASWSLLSKDPDLRKKYVDSVCKNILSELSKKENNGHYGRRKY